MKKVYSDPSDQQSVEDFGIEFNPAKVSKFPTNTGNKSAIEDMYGMNIDLEVQQPLPIERVVTPNKVSDVFTPVNLNDKTFTNPTINSLAFLGNTLFEKITNGLAELSVNLVGFAGGILQFRDFVVYDGKGAEIAKFFGTNKQVTFRGKIVSASTAIDSTGGMSFGGDTDLYRSATNKLRIGNNEILTANQTLSTAPVTEANRIVDETFYNSTILPRQTTFFTVPITGAVITSVPLINTYYTLQTFAVNVPLNGKIKLDFVIQTTWTAGPAQQFLFTVDRETAPASGVFVGIMNFSAGNSQGIRFFVSTVNLANTSTFAVSDLSNKTAGSYNYRIRYQNATTTTGFTIFTTLSSVNYSVTA